MARARARARKALSTHVVQEREVADALVEVAREREQDPARARVVRLAVAVVRLEDPPPAAERHRGPAAARAYLSIRGFLAPDD